VRVAGEKVEAMLHDERRRTTATASVTARPQVRATARVTRSLLRSASGAVETAPIHPSHIRAAR
jgi:hypothetical protein